MHAGSRWRARPSNRRPRCHRNDGRRGHQRPFGPGPNRSEPRCCERRSLGPVPLSGHPDEHRTGYHRCVRRRNPSPNLNGRSRHGRARNGPSRTSRHGSSCSSVPRFGVPRFGVRRPSSHPPSGLRTSSPHPSNPPPSARRGRRWTATMRRRRRPSPPNGNGRSATNRTTKIEASDKPTGERADPRPAPGPKTGKGPPKGPFSLRNPAASYSPRESPPKYHRRWWA
jgi:hypothetical protein